MNKIFYKIKSLMKEMNKIKNISYKKKFIRQKIKNNKVFTKVNTSLNDIHNLKKEIQNLQEQIKIAKNTISNLEIKNKKEQNKFSLLSKEYENLLDNYNGLLKNKEKEKENV